MYITSELLITEILRLYSLPDIIVASSARKLLVSNRKIEKDEPLYSMIQNKISSSFESLHIGIQPSPIPEIENEFRNSPFEELTFAIPPDK